MSRSRVDELESIRGLAALLVVVHHFPKWHPVLDIPFINNSYLMVEIFFVLSGFVIYNAYSDSIRSPRDLLRFQFLRIGRLYPVHLIFFLAFFAVEIAKYVAASKFGAADIRSTAFDKNSFQAAVQQLFLVQALIPNNDVLTFNGPAWSISVELFAYVVFGTLVLVAGRWRDAVFALICAAALVVLVVDPNAGMSYLYRCLAGFFLGCLTAKFAHRSTVRLPGHVSSLALTAIAVFITVKEVNHLDYLVYFLAVLLIFAVVRSDGRGASSLLRASPLLYLGKISYSVYMSHFIVMWAVALVFKRVLHRPEVISPMGKYVLQLSVGEVMVGCAATMLAVLVVSHLTYNFVEKPFRERSRRIASTGLFTRAASRTGAAVGS